MNSSILKFFTAIKKIKFKVCILNADWLVVNTRLMFIGCRVRLQLRKGAINAQIALL